MALDGIGARQSAYPTVDVLLATFNGEDFLHDLLRSLSNQKYVYVNLMVSDDGSSDNTLKILHGLTIRSSGAIKNIQIFEGPRKGPKANFLFLLNRAKNSYVAFADQDDIWSEVHLHRSVNRIRTHENNSLEIPVLTFTNVLEFWEGTNKISIFPAKPYRTPSLFENPSRGCTQVMNRALLELVLELSIGNESNILMHDWWVLLIAQSFGEVCYSPIPEILYRNHKNNFTKKYRFSLERIENAFQIIFRGRTWSPLIQLYSLPTTSRIRSITDPLLAFDMSKP